MEINNTVENTLFEEIEDILYARLKRILVR